MTNNKEDTTFDKKVEELKSYIQRVNNGEDMESVQKDFKENFSHVPAKMIAKAEQAMMADGAKMEDIQKLCDIHSVLFHDMTDEERMQRLKEEMEAHQQPVYVETKKIDNVSDEVSEKTIAYQKEEGHPLNILTVENNAIQEFINKISEKLEKTDNVKDDIIKLTDIKQHYAKKDDLILPLLKDKYDFPGPANIMWGVEDEIRLQLHNTTDKQSILDVLKRIDEMIYKEENVLFPLCSENFTEDEWIQIAEEMHKYGPCLVDKLPKWDKKLETKEETSINDDKISLPGGTLTLKQIRAILNIIPMEITIIDENNINKFFDEDENKVFLRPKIALNREMQSCHPPRVLDMVNKLLEDFKNNKRDSMHVLAKVDGKQVLTNYYALRDDENNYLGTMEAVIHIDGIVNCIKEDKKGMIKPEEIFPN